MFNDEEKIINTEEVSFLKSTKSPHALGGYLKKKDAEKQFKDIKYILLGVVLILLIMVATLVIDSFHFNSAVYKEYSEKMENIKDIKEINGILLEENKNNQNIIVENQEIIKNLLENK